MQSTLLFAVFGAVSASAIVPRASPVLPRQNLASYDFTLNAVTYSHQRGVLRTLSDGQLRLGDGSIPVANFTFRPQQGIIDSHGRGCISTPGPTNQFQCDEGVKPMHEFELSCDGQLLFNGSREFWACSVDDHGVQNLYIEPVPSQLKCVYVELYSWWSQPDVRNRTGCKQPDRQHGWLFPWDKFYNNSLPVQPDTPEGARQMENYLKDSQNASARPTTEEAEVGHSVQSPDGRCGAQTGFHCFGKVDGNCCSPHGWCGLSSAHCGAGCQNEYGICDSSSSAKAHKDEVTSTKSNTGSSATVKSTNGAPSKASSKTSLTGKASSSAVSSGKTFATSALHTGKTSTGSAPISGETLIPSILHSSKASTTGPLHSGKASNTSALHSNEASSTATLFSSKTLSTSALHSGKTSTSGTLQSGKSSGTSAVYSGQTSTASIFESGKKEKGSTLQSEKKASSTALKSGKASTSSPSFSSKAPTSSTSISTKALATSTPKQGAVSPNGQCGGDHGYHCNGFGAGSCCSSAGWCGSTSGHCGSGCQSRFGTCGKSSSGATTSAAPTPSKIAVSPSSVPFFRPVGNLTYPPVQGCNATAHGIECGKKFSSNGCPLNLDGAFEAPRFMVTVDKAHPNKAVNNNFDGTIGDEHCTVYNFHVSSENASQKCSLVWLFPEEEHEKSSTVFRSGEDSPALLEFWRVREAARDGLTWNEVGPVRIVAAGPVRPGFSCNAKTVACVAGSDVSFMLCGQNFHLKYDQDAQSPNPVGLYIRTC